MKECKGQEWKLFPWLKTPQVIRGLVVTFIVFANFSAERWATKKIASPKEEYLKSKPQMSILKKTKTSTKYKKNPKPRNM